MTKPDLPAIKDRLRAATPGPWYVDDSGISEGRGVVDRQVSDPMSEFGIYIAACSIRPGEQAQQNASFIAHSRKDVEKLVEEVERLRANAMDTVVAGVEFIEMIIPKIQDSFQPGLMHSLLVLKGKIEKQKAFAEEATIVDDKQGNAGKSL